MSSKSKSRNEESGIDLFISRIDQLKLSPEKEMQVKSLFQTYSDSIQSDDSHNSESIERFSSFKFFPGIALVIDSENNVIFQNRPFNDLYITSEKSFGACFNTDSLKKLQSALQKVNSSGKTEELFLSDKEGKFYDCIISHFDGEQKLKLLFLYPNKHAGLIEKANKDINDEALLLLEQSNLPIKFYFLEENKFIPIFNNDNVWGESGDLGDEYFFDPISEITSSLKNMMMDSLKKREIRIDHKEKEIDGLKAGRKVIIPISDKCVCLLSELKEESKSSNSVNELIEKYRLIANSLPDLFFILDKELKFTFITPSIEPALEYKYQELIGEGFDSLVPEWSGNTLKKNLDSILSSENDISQPLKFIVQLSGKYGNLKWYEVQITGIYNNDNELQGFNGICRDISERLKYEEALMQAKRKAEESDKLKSAFLANMSHEIRTPLNGIIGFSTMLNNKNLSDEKKEKYTNFIISSSKQLLMLISDIIDISKIEAGQLSFVTTKIDLPKLFTELYATIDMERRRMNKDKIKLEFQIPTPFKHTLITDEFRLKQVLINLLSNALKFTMEGSIEFGYVLQSENTVRFYVKDSGEGIPAELQRAVFERFHRGNVDKHTNISGTGLGLAISKGIIELLGGEINLISKETIGSEFYFTLPVSERLK